MSSYKNPQEFNIKLKPYDQYVEELRAWCIVTDLAKEKEGVAIAVSLPENEPSGVRDKVFNEITLTNLNNEEGINTFFFSIIMNTHKENKVKNMQQCPDCNILCNRGKIKS